MDPLRSRSHESQEKRPASVWSWLLLAAFGLLIMYALAPRRGKETAVNTVNPGNTSGLALSSHAGKSAADSLSRLHRASAGAVPPLTAEEIVAAKLSQFGKNRRKLVHSIAKHFGLPVPSEVERFFDAVESGRWEEIDAAHAALLAP